MRVPLSGDVSKKLERAVAVYFKSTLHRRRSALLVEIQYSETAHEGRTTAHQGGAMGLQGHVAG